MYWHRWSCFLSPALMYDLARIEVAGAEALRIAAVSTLVIVLMGALTYLCAPAAAAGMQAALPRCYFRQC